MDLFTRADIYGGPAVTPADTPAVQQSAGVPVSGKGPAVSWLGLVLALIALRVLYELAD